MTTTGFRKCKTEGCPGNSHPSNSGAAKEMCPACYRRDRRNSPNKGPARRNVGVYKVQAKVTLHTWDALMEAAEAEDRINPLDGTPSLQQATRKVLEDEVSKYAANIPDRIPVPRGESDTQVQATLKGSTIAAIEAICEREGMSRYAVVQRVLELWAVKHKTTNKHSQCYACGTYRP